MDNINLKNDTLFFKKYEKIHYIVNSLIIDNELYYLSCIDENNLKLISINLETFKDKILLNLYNNNVDYTININIKNYKFITNTAILEKEGIYIFDNENNLNFIDLKTFNIKQISQYNKNNINTIIRNNYEIYYISQTSENININSNNLDINNKLHYLYCEKAKVYKILDKQFNIIFKIYLIFDNNHKYYIKNNELYIYCNTNDIIIKYFDNIFIISNKYYIITCNKNEILSYNYYINMNFVSDTKIVFTCYNKYQLNYFFIYDIINKDNYIIPKYLERYIYSFMIINNEYILINYYEKHILLNFNMINEDINLELLKIKYNCLHINESLKIIEKVFKKDNDVKEFHEIKKLFFELLFNIYKYKDILDELYKQNEIIYKEIIIFVLNKIKN